jgi:hypothetical protein
MVRTALTEGKHRTVADAIVVFGWLVTVGLNGVPITHRLRSGH